MTRARWFIAGALALLLLAAAPIGSVVTSAPIYGRGTAQDPIRITGLSTSGNSTTATALAANGTNCTAGQFATGVDQSGNAEGCSSAATALGGTRGKWCAVGDSGFALCDQSSPVTAADYAWPIVTYVSGNTLFSSIPLPGDMQPPNGPAISDGCAITYSWNDDSWECLPPQEVDPRLPHCNWKQTILGTDAGTYSCVDQVDPAYGELEDTHGTHTIALTAQGEYYPWTTGAVGECYNITCLSGFAVDAGLDDSVGYLQITQAGAYRVSFNGAFTIGTANQVIEADLFVERGAGDTGVGTEIEKCSSSVKLTGAGDEKTIAWNCVLDARVGDKLHVRFADETAGSQTLTITHATLVVTNIAPTVAVGEFTGNYVESLATASPLSGGASPGQAVAISLGLRDCGQGKILRSYDGGWNCVDPPVGSVTAQASNPVQVSGTLDPIVFLDGEDCPQDGLWRWDRAEDLWECVAEADPTVNALGKSSGPNTCGQGQVPIQGDGGWGCTGILSGPLIATRWCTANDAGVIECQATTPLETDPQVGTLNATKWCTATDAGFIECKETAPSFTETDPQVGTLVATKWCTANDAGNVECQATAPVVDETDPLSVHLTGDQTVAGLKTFNENVTLNNSADLVFGYSIPSNASATISVDDQPAYSGRVGHILNITGSAGANGDGDGNNPQVGGAIVIRAGKGGDPAYNMPPVAYSGRGANLYIFSGQGGDGYSWSKPGGGGSIYISPGGSGSSTADGNVFGGSVYIEAGPAYNRGIGALASAGNVEIGSTYVPKDVIVNASSSILLNAPVTIGSGSSPITTTYRGSASWNMPYTTRTNCANTTITVTGAAVGSEVSLGLPSTWGNTAICNAWVATANIVALNCCCIAATYCDPDTLTFTARVWNP